MIRAPWSRVVWGSGHWRSDALSAVEHRPADVVPQPLVVEDELANRLRELVALPPALQSPGALARAFRRSSTCGFDRIGGRTELVRGGVCAAGHRARPGHRDLATHPGAGL